MSDSLLLDEAINVLFAGQDTTISVLTWFCYLLTKHPEVQDKIMVEINDIAVDKMQGSILSGLVYTKASLYETLRLYPGVYGLARRALKDIKLDGNSIPKGTIIVTSIYATHRSEVLWDRPDEFNPERFLDQDLVRPKYAFMPFGAGMHHCIGRHFAEIEMLVIIVSLLKHFRISGNLGHVREASSITLKPNKDIIVTLEPRNARYETAANCL